MPLRGLAGRLQQRDRAGAIASRIRDHGVGPAAVHFIEAARKIGVDFARRFGATRGLVDAAVPGEDFGGDRHVMVLRGPPRCAAASASICSVTSSARSSAPMPLSASA